MMFRESLFKVKEFSPINDVRLIHKKSLFGRIAG
jgi:hypothetical protein